MNESTKPAKFIAWAKKYCESKNSMWDRPAEFLFLRERPMGDIVEKIGAVGKAPYEELVGEAMHGLVAKLESTNDTRVLNFDAVALVTEGWAPPASMAEEIASRRAAGGSVGRFADLEGRREMRLVSVMGTGFKGVVAWNRGEPAPEYVVDGEGDGKNTAGGKTFDELEKVWKFVQEVRTLMDAPEPSS